MTERPPTATDSSPQVGCSDPDGAGSPTSQRLQERFGTAEQARIFYKHSVFDRLEPWMERHVSRRREVFIASSGAGGACDCSVKIGRPGFIRVLDAQALAIPLYAGNGVHATVANVTDNPYVGLAFWTPGEGMISLQINGKAEIAEGEDVAAGPTQLSALEGEGAAAARWLFIHINEVFVRCDRHNELLDLEKPEPWTEVPEED